MNENLDLEKAISALDSYGLEQKQSSDLTQARNKKQMTAYLETLDYSLRRMKLLQEAIIEMVDSEEQRLLRQEKIQTFKTKVINLSRQYNISYDEVLQIMASNS
ncbi:hypothetical protein D5018_13000 [Parashewanella curva]|uniref:Uncharacterized protein n=1 Tax=Parashewanella curva TaxID=2338552 RepID=A0A3L8PV33_9GAMM|nr:hypothetical protein [Parashewanella curva]RLV59261.1 hypothetical protein D5018_13000 [Parashewanella curva]